MTRTLQQNLDVLRVIGCDDIVARIAELPEQSRPLAAAAAVREAAPVRDAILGATDDELPSVVGRLLAAAVTR